MSEAISYNGEALELGEIGRQVARLRHVRGALDATGTAVREDWGDSGHFAWNLAERFADELPTEFDEFGIQTVYSLNRAIPSAPDEGRDHLSTILNSTLTLGDTPDSEVIYRSRQITRLATVFALERCGVIEPSDERTDVSHQVPLAVRAAFAYFRGNIHQELDRRVYDSEDEILELADAHQVPFRKITNPRNPNDEFPIYELLGRIPENVELAPILPGFEGTSLQVWWSELDNDLAAINGS